MQVKPGQIWSHYKAPNKRYEIIAISKDSDTLEDIVIYKALYQGEFKFGQLWNRKLSEFLEVINKDGKELYRFNLIER
jgi:hypothetical protein